ncbi:MAG: class I SAM-dependent methyltransferase [Methanobrevibacter sp.]|jgi:SAM-dependent methyltransferase|nr:class I SAM-dependent methyltransferase [Methanobrevibacter sp.]
MTKKTKIVSDFYGKEYSKKSKYQEFMGEKLIKMIDFDKYHYILDLGCGNGTNGIKMAKNKNTFIDGFDAAKESIKIANEKKESLGIKNIKFFIEDAYKFNEKNKYDLVFSNFAINWIGPKSFEIAYNTLKQEGKLIASIGLGYEGISYGHEEIVLEAIDNLGYSKYFENYIEKIYHPRKEEAHEDVKKANFKNIDIEQLAINQKPFYDSLKESYISVLITELNFKYLYLENDQQRQNLFNECLKICLEKKPQIINLALIISADK